MPVKVRNKINGWRSGLGLVLGLLAIMLLTAGAVVLAFTSMGGGYAGIGGGLAGVAVALVVYLIPGAGAFVALLFLVVWWIARRRAMRTGTGPQVQK